MGLIKAQNRDLTGACELLTKSLKFYKRNTDARNLLGLVYFEMGEAVQAFAQWLISASLDPTDNPAENYINRLQKNQNKLSVINQSIKKFNLALKSAKSGDDDIAIIQLKKILNTNPNLVKGHLLLALLYMKKGAYERAKKPVKRALKIDACNPIARSYEKEIQAVMSGVNQQGNRVNSDPESRETYYVDHASEQINKEIKNGYDIILPEKREKFVYSNSRLFTMINIGAGLLMGAVIAFFLMMPAKEKSINEKHNKEMLKLNTRIDSLNNTNADLQNQVASLTAERDNLSAQVTGLDAEGGSVMSDYDNLINAMNFYNGGDYVSAAVSLKNIVNTSRSPVFQNLYQTIQPTAFQETAKAYYNNAMAENIDSGSIEVYERIIANVKEMFNYEYTAADYVNACERIADAYERRYDAALATDINTAAAYKADALTALSDLINNVLAPNAGIDTKAIENIQNHINSISAK